MKWAVPSVDICTTLTLILVQYQLNFCYHEHLTVNRLKEKHKFGRNNSNCFHYELQRRPLMNLDLVQLIFSVDFIEFQCLVVRVIKRRKVWKTSLLHCSCCSWCRFSTSCGMETWCSLRSLKEAGSGRREGKLKPKLIEICLLIKSCIPTILVLVFPSRAPRRSYSTAGENNQRSSQRPALCLFFLP